MKFPADPESRRAWIGIETLDTISVITIVRGCMF